MQDYESEVDCSLQYHPFWIVNQTWVPWKYKLCSKDNWEVIDPQQTKPFAVRLQVSCDFINLREVKLDLSSEDDAFQIKTSFFENAPKILSPKPATVADISNSFILQVTFLLIKSSFFFSHSNLK